MALLGGKKSKASQHSSATQPRRMREDLLEESAAFRMNRTISSFRKEQGGVSERSVAHQRQDAQHNRLRWMSVAIVSALVIVGISFQMAIAITIQTPDTASQQSAAVYRKTIDDYYAMRPAERFTPFLNYQTLKEHIMQQTPEVKTVRVEPFGAGLARVKLTFRQPLAQWSSNGKTYFVDDEGVTFEQNYFATPNLAVKDQSGAPLSGGQEVVNRRFLGFLGQAVSRFAKANITVTEIVLPQDTVRQVLFLIHDKPYAVKMTVDRAADAQVAQAIKAMRYIDERSLRPEYIDVRVDQRVFYK